MASFAINNAATASCALRSAGVAQQSGQTAILRGAPVSRTQSARIQMRASKGVYAAVELPKQYSTVKPVADRIFLKLAPQEEYTVGGILLPSSSSSNKPTQGSVVACGPGRTGEKGLVPIGVKVGDTVSYSKYAGTEVEVKGENFILVKEDDCIGTITGTAVSTLKPLADRVLIKCQKAEEESSGGVLLAGSSKEKPLTGVVVAVGPGKMDEESGAIKPIEIAVGAEVMYSKYTGTEFEDADADVTYIVVKEADVLATLS